MRSQMELALTIGTIIIGAVLIIVSLVISWQMIMPLTDALKIAAGIGYDVKSLEEASFSFPGDINIYYSPPSVCEPMSEYTGNPSSTGWICQALLGGNPNITGVSFGYVNSKVDLESFGGSFYPFEYGISEEAPGYSLTTVSYNYIPEPNKPSMQGYISIPGFLTYSPEISLTGIGGTLIEQGNLKDKIVLGKHLTPYGDMISNAYSIDAIESLINNGIFQSCQNKNNYSVFNVDLPYYWALGFKWDTNSKSILVCEYRFTLNSLEHFYYDPVIIKNLNKKVGYDNYDFGGFDYLFDDFNVILFNGSNVYDPFNQTNVKKYNVGWLEVRCFNLTELERLNSQIVDISVEYQNNKNNWGRYFDSPNENFVISKRYLDKPMEIPFNVSCTKDGGHYYIKIDVVG